MIDAKSKVIVRETKLEDIPGIIALCREVYPESPPWTEAQLNSHLKGFPEGQFVAVELPSERVVGVASSLIILWDDYGIEMGWRDFTDGGYFTNHDPEKGRTLYGAEVMVQPGLQGHGVGKKLYEARRNLARRMKLLRIRAGARLRGYGKYSPEMSAEEYVAKVISGEIGDPTLSFQLKQGFHVLAVVPDYLRNDPESQGYAAVIEWINEDVAKPEDYRGKQLFLSRVASKRVGD